MKRVLPGDEYVYAVSTTIEMREDVSAIRNIRGGDVRGMVVWSYCTFDTMV